MGLDSKRLTRLVFFFVLNVVNPSCDATPCISKKPCIVPGFLLISAADSDGRSTSDDEQIEYISWHTGIHTGPFPIVLVAKHPSGWF